MQQGLPAVFPVITLYVCWQVLTFFVKVIENISYETLECALFMENITLFLTEFDREWEDHPFPWKFILNYLQSERMLGQYINGECPKTRKSICDVADFKTHYIISLES